MVKVLSVAEKPSVAREIASILSRGSARTRDGPSRFNKLFEFTCAFQGNANASMIVTSVAGHLMEMDFGEAHRKWGRCDPVELFHAPIFTQVPDDKADMQRNLEQVCAKRHVCPLCAA